MKNNRGQPRVRKQYLRLMKDTGIDEALLSDAWKVCYDLKDFSALIYAGNRDQLESIALMVEIERQRGTIPGDITRKLQRQGLLKTE